MRIVKLLATTALCVASIASAQDVLLSGHVQRIILEPSGTPNCPPVCPLATPQPDGSTLICVSNAGGCQTMEVKVDHVYLGDVRGDTREFKSRIGEFGPSFRATSRQIVISEEAGVVAWSDVTKQNGKIYIEPTALRSIGGVRTSVTGLEELVALDEVLARVKAAR